MTFKDYNKIIYCSNEYYEHNGTFEGFTRCKKSNKNYYRGYLLHRENGPTAEWTSGGKMWYLNGIRYEEEYKIIISFKKKNEILSGI